MPAAGPQPGSAALRGARACRSSATGGLSLQAGTVGGSTSQGCFRFTQMWATTSSSSLRSSVPARTTTTPGRALFELKMRVWQTAHSRWIDVLPLGVLSS